MRTCTKCGLSKSLDAFYAHRVSGKTHHSRCIECKKREYRETYAKGSITMQYGHLKKYWPGLTTKQAYEKYQEMSIAQNHCCKICDKPEKGKRLAVDHDHITKVVRGLLCENCNRALGLIKESFDASLKLAQYIQEHKGTL